MLEADARTYWDNQGILEDALEILLIRRDRPGLMAVSKIDPAAMMLPPTPLAGRPSDEELARDISRVTQQQQYDLLAYGRRHEGAADYFVLATFAGAWDGPLPLRVVDPAGPKVPAESETALVAAAPADETVPATPGLTASFRNQAGRAAIVGAFRVAARSTSATPPFLSIVMAPLRTTGRPLSEQFGLTVTREQAYLVGSFAVPVSALSVPNSAPQAGRYLLFASVSDESVTRVIAIP